MFKIRTGEPGPVLWNLDLNRTLVGDLYLGIWTRTLLCTHPYSFLYSWPNIGDSYGTCVYQTYKLKIVVILPYIINQFAWHNSDGSPQDFDAEWKIILPERKRNNLEKKSELKLKFHQQCFKKCLKTKLKSMVSIGWSGTNSWQLSRPRFMSAQ